MPFPGGSKCAKSDRVSRALATGNGLRIGMSRSDVVAKIGAPSRQGKRWLQRTCNTKKPMTEEERKSMGALPGAQWDTLSAVTALFDGAGRMVAFRVTWFVGGDD